MAFNFVKDNKCFGKVIRGAHTIESISAGETSGQASPRNFDFEDVAQHPSI